MPAATRVLDGAQQGFFGSDVDSGGRADQHQHLRVAGQGPRHHHLLLVAAGKRGNRKVGAGRLDGQLVDQPARHRVPPTRGDEAVTPEPLRHGHGDVLRDRHQRHETLPVAVLRHQSRRRRASAAGTLPGRSRRPDDAEFTAARAAQAHEGLGDLHLAAASAAGQADDLAGPDGERNALRQPGDLQLADVQQRWRLGGDGRAVGGTGQVDVLARHRGDQLVAAKRRRPARSRCAGRRGTPSRCRRSRRSPAGGG